MTAALPTFLLGMGLWAWLLGLFPGADEGRRGNGHAEAGRYAEAGLAYTEGLATYDAHASPQTARYDIPARLLHNAALAEYEQEAYPEARTSFLAAANAALSPDLAAAAQYGAGLAAAREEDYEAALGHFRDALRFQPGFPAAAYNWEWVRRQMADANPPEDEQPEPPEPTPFAENLKAQADELVAARRYREAYDLMVGGLAQDSTVAAFADFTGRVGSVADIDEL